MERNVAGQKLTVFAFTSADGEPASGEAGSISGFVQIDGGALNPLTDGSATEISAANAKGYYDLDLAQAETNGKKLFFAAKSSTTGVIIIVQPSVVYTTPANFFEFMAALTEEAIAGPSIVIPGPTSPEVSVGHLITYDGQGTVKPSVSMRFRKTSEPSATGASSDGEWFTAVSDADGLVSEEFVRGATYEGKRGNVVAESFTVPDDDEFELPSILGIDA